MVLAVRPVMTQEEVHIVAYDFNGASWWRRSGPEEQFDRTLEEAFKNTMLPVPGSTLCGGPGFQANRLTYAGLSSRRRPNRNGSFGNTGHLR